jgi:streptogrisin C
MPEIRLIAAPGYARAARACALAALLPWIVSASAFAQTAQPPAEQASLLEPEMLAALQRDLGWQPEEAVKRLQAEARAAQTEAALRAERHAWFGGAWLSADGSTLYVGTNSRQARQQIRERGAVPVVVAYSESTLLEMQAVIDTRLGTRAMVTYVDVAANAVVVQVAAAAMEAVRNDLLNTRKVDMNAVRLVAGEPPSLMMSVQGGNRFDVGAGYCSIGFAVAGGFVTAGHCGRPGDSTALPSGTFAGSSFPGNDYAWVRVADGETPEGYVNNHSGGRLRVGGAAPATVGASVCRSGATTGFRCGQLQAREARAAFNNGTAVVTGLIRTSACADQGDSGGPLLAGDQAQGVLSGGQGNCSAGGTTTTYFQPVPEILANYGLELLVPPVDPPPPPPADRSPIGWLDIAQATADGLGLEVYGWTADQDMQPPTDPIQFDLQIDGVAAGRYVARDLRPDVAAVYPELGPRHGFHVARALPPGRHTVCVFARNYRPLGATDTAPATSLGCPVVEVGTVASQGAITSLFNGKCLDVDGANPADMTRVQMWTCNGTAAQQWSLQADSTVRALGKCLDVAGGNTANGSVTWLYTCNGTGAQTWERLGDGSLRNPQSGRCLDVLDLNTNDGAAVGIWDCHGNTNQRWSFPR